MSVQEFSWNRQCKSTSRTVEFKTLSVPMDALFKDVDHHPVCALTDRLMEVHRVLEIEGYRDIHCRYDSKVNAIVFFGERASANQWRVPPPVPVLNLPVGAQPRRDGQCVTTCESFFRLDGRCALLAGALAPCSARSNSTGGICFVWAQAVCDLLHLEE